MTRLILNIYEVLRAHRLLRWLSLAALTVLLAVLTVRQTYQEDISAFLPMDDGQLQAMKDFEKRSGADRIVAIFEHADSGAVSQLVDAIDRFALQLEQCDSLGMVSELMTQAGVEQMEQMMASLYDNIPYLLTPDDYDRMDSLLSDEGYVARQLAADKQMLMFPVSGLLAQNVQRDPLNLFTPVVERLRQKGTDTAFQDYDGYLVSPDGRRAIAVMRSAFGASETDHNGQLVDMLNQCADSVRLQSPAVDIRFIGGPVVAVGNARQIKSDSLLSVGLAVVLIVSLLFAVFRRLWPLVLIVLSIGWGWLFAMGMLAVIHDSVSVIVIGISSVILGIAVNYPLHLIAHLQHTPDMRSALKEIVMPLVVGNVTTVGAFLALVPLQSVALRDLGLFSALLLVGTIVFVLLYLPHMVQAPTPRQTSSSSALLRRMASFSPGSNPRLVMAVLLLTVLFGYYSLQTSFDADMSHINYMTPQQRTDMSLLTSASPASASSASPASAPASSSAPATTPGGFPPGLPSGSSLWNAFVSRHAATLRPQLEQAATAEGFAPGTFAPFFRLLTPLPTGHSPLTTGFASQLVQRLSDDFNYIGWACGLIVFFFLWFSLGSVELALLSFLPMAVSWLWILGIMALLGIQFNVVNVILATFIFGQGDDYTIFMTEGCQYEYAYRRRMLTSYKQSIIVSALIMFIGIGTLIIARHPALRSLAEVTIVGMFAVVLMAWLFPPLIFRWLVTDRQGRYRRRPVTLRGLLHLCRADDPYRLVSDRYRYRGVEISAAVDRRLRHLRRHPGELPVPRDGHLDILDEGWGETALLAALLHPDAAVTARLSDDDRLLVARYAAEDLTPNITHSK
ncbi:MAG: MMPL family transporter [Prevotella sp.]|nr:MMPL family transporter [Prevotella sp.]